MWFFYSYLFYFCHLFNFVAYFSDSFHFCYSFVLYVFISLFKDNLFSNQNVYINYILKSEYHTSNTPLVKSIVGILKYTTPRQKISNKLVCIHSKMVVLFTRMLSFIYYHLHQILVGLVWFGAFSFRPRFLLFYADRFFGKMVKD